MRHRRAGGRGAPSSLACLLPAQLAWLATQAVPDIARDQAVALLERAAQDASTRLTHEAAGRHFEEAAALTDDPLEWARLTLQSGHAYQRAGALELARERYTGLLEVADVEDAECAPCSASTDLVMRPPSASRRTWCACSTRPMPSYGADPTGLCGPRFWRLAAARVPTSWSTTDRAGCPWPLRP